MTDFVPQPCARWSDSLAAHPDDLSAEERRALDAHVAACQACAAVRADYQHMETRIRSLPDPRTRPDFPPWLLALQAAAKRDASDSRQIIPFHSMETHMKMRKEPASEVPAPTPITQGQHSRRRVVSWVAAVAALVVVALMSAALLASHAGTPTKTGNNNNATPSPAASKDWTSPAGLSNLPDQPYIAPSNPQIIYLMASNAGAAPTSLKRSTDGGAHWTAVPLPPLAIQANNAYFQISAGNAQNVFLLLTFDLSSSACSGSQASSGPINGYSGNSCSLPYYSTDGGTFWSLMRCQGCGQTLYTSGNLAPVGTILSQGQRLYSFGGVHLITSKDGGAIWTPADAALLAQGQIMCSFAAAPTDVTIFELTQAGGCSQPEGYGPQPIGVLLHAAMHPQAGSTLSIWRSDDAGAHWTQASVFPYQQPDIASFSAIDTGSGQPLLFLNEGQGGTYSRLMSVDEGKTWQPQPMSGIPSSVTTFDFVPTTLSDGSLLMETQLTYGGSTTFYALKPGSQTWVQIAPALTDGPIEVAVVSSGGHDTLWVVTAPNGDPSAGVYNISYDTLP